jgi:uncharacterized membrane protein
MRMMNDTSNNLIIVALLLAIAGYVIFLVAKRKQIPDRIYIPIIFLMSISLVLPLALRSNHLIGADINSEYYIFQQTLQNARWQPVMHNILDSCLSISILPSIYQSFLVVNSEYLFKILYPVIFSISPVVVYLITRKYLSSLYSFLAIIFFMSQVSFIDAELSPRTVIALLFVALTIMALFRKGLRTFDRYLLFIIFSIAVILSHYTTAFIFLLVLVLTWLIMLLIRLVILRRKSRPTIGTKYNGKSLWNANDQQRYSLTFGMILFYSTFMYIWDKIVCGEVYHMFITFFSTTYYNMYNFFDLENRGPGALILGSKLGSENIAQHIIFIFSWSTIILIAVGVIATIVRYGKATTIYSENGDNHPSFLIRKFDAEFFISSLVCCLLLAISIVVPYILVGYDINRIYIQAMIVTTPFFVIGGIVFSRVFKKFMHSDLSYIVILLFLIPFFMCNCGIINQFFSVPPLTITLNSKGLNYDSMYIHEQETYAAKWISNFANMDTAIYSDFYGSARLISQGSIPLAEYSGSLIEDMQTFDGYFFLRYTGVVNGMLLDSNYQWHNLSQYNEQFIHKNIIYSNGGSTVFR